MLRGISMKKLKISFLAGLISAAGLQAGQALSDLDKIFAHFARITNHTSQDVFIQAMVHDPKSPDGMNEGKLIILKPGKTIHNISLNFIPMYKDQLSSSKKALIGIGDASNKDLLYLRLIAKTNKNNSVAEINISLVQANNYYVDSEGKRHNYADPDLINLKESLNIQNEKRFDIGLVLDLRGEDLLQSELDVIAFARAN